MKSARKRPIYFDPNLQLIFGVTLSAVMGVSSITPAFPAMARELGMPVYSVGLLITVFTLPVFFLALCSECWQTFGAGLNGDNLPWMGN
ncbi:MAG: hypothetical protein WBN83_15045 [Desulfoprunum sp.]|jgi:hypothetical protein|uniref:hypothetical protein n=1 Tax=Desulfoprunum sp. TaxID=2020866 RepID=UPI00052BCBEB|nr:hypothetical protein JT06_18495 [Desulfobulbus sp. Tol-SR]